MKVLFAVNSESISDAIIKKYQKDYREILSYKNVYYFNAIQKEIQKDKSYDRIVISEDLEPFSNNNYESIDKFIFEKLDAISDEAHDLQGNEMSIILIASDRHTKGSSFLVKMFGIGVYNALLGNDRSMEEVCRLINKPRTKKEAKMYYKIDTEDVNYKSENEDEVSELEIKNIISHFKKLGKNTEKFAGSFENIAEQYTDEQLKIIINCLPINVKAVLEETSSKYQEMMAVRGTLVKGVKSTDTATMEAQKRTGIKIDIIENKLNQNKITKPIVIPNSVKTSRTTNINKVTQTNSDVASNAQEKVVPKVITQKTAVQSKAPAKEQVVAKKVVRAEEEIAQAKPKTVKPVRKVVANSVNVAPKKAPLKVEIEDEELEDIELPDIDFETDVVETLKVEANQEEQVKKRRGRPRKNPVEPEIENKPKGKRGRPRKNVQEEVEELDDLAEIKLEENIEFDFSDDEILDNFEKKAEELDFDEEFSEENQLPELDEIEDIEDFDELEDLEEIEPIDEFEELEDLDTFELADDEFDFAETDEAFDEFEDYDEYGKYNTQMQKEENIDELYDEDILSAEEEDDIIVSDLLAELDEDEEVDEFDDETITVDFEEDEESLQEPSDELELITDFDDDLSIDEFETDELNDYDDDIEDEDLLVPAADFDDIEELDFEVKAENSNAKYQPKNELNYEAGALESIKSPIDYSMSNLNSLLTKDKKIVTFLGTSKNGVSFLVNNLAEIFASVGINTAILDMTKNKNSYYIYTQNKEELRKIAYTSIENLQEGMASGIRVKQNLTVYTALPNDGKDYSNAEPILSTLVQNHSLVLVDCDFNTDPSYFGSCQEIYLVQSMDILTIQPLTAFLRDLKIQGVLEPEKVRIVINKELKVRDLRSKDIINGMAYYNDPAMSFMTELFNKDVVKYCSIPFEEMAYSKYLESILKTKVSINGYSKNFMNKLRVLGDMVYPLTSRQTYKSGYESSYKQSGFSSSMTDTLNKMKKKY